MRQESQNRSCLPSAKVVSNNNVNYCEQLVASGLSQPLSYANT